MVITNLTSNEYRFDAEAGALQYLHLAASGTATVDDSYYYEAPFRREIDRLLADGKISIGTPPVHYLVVDGALVYKPQVQELGASGPSDNVNSVTTLAAVVGARHALSSLHASYSDPAVTGTIVVKDGVTVVWQSDLTGSIDHDFEDPVVGTVNTAMTVTLSASGTGGKTGSVSVEGHKVYVA